MVRKSLCLVTFALLAALPSRAQIAPPNEAGVSIGHLHAMAQNADAEKNFWVAIGGTVVGTGRMPVVKFPGILVLINQATDIAGGSAGSVVDHATFLVKDAKAALAKFKEAGLTPVQPVSTVNPDAFLAAPSGIRVEFHQDSSIQEPIVFGWIEWATADAAALQTWYAKTFGAAAKGKTLESVMPGGNLKFGKTASTTAGTRGRGLDHIGFEVKDLASICKQLEAAGQKFDAPCNPRPGAAVNITYITDPIGTYIELTQGLTRY